jgi:hypothetical protein
MTTMEKTVEYKLSRTMSAVIPETFKISHGTNETTVFVPGKSFVLLENGKKKATFEVAGAGFKGNEFSVMFGENPEVYSEHLPATTLYYRMEGMREVFRVTADEGALRILVRKEAAPTA